MDYYKAKRQLNILLQDYINRNKGSKQSISRLELNFGREFGFGRKQILSAIEPYIKLGIVEIKEDMMIIK